MTTRPDGTTIGLPVIVVTGAQKGPVFVVDACTHAEEAEGTVAAIRLSKQVDPRELRGTLVLVPVSNVPAFNIRLRHDPHQRPPMQDMALIFPGNPAGSITQRLAHAYYTEVMRKANYVISIHTGGDGSYNVERVMVQDQIPESLEMAKAMGGEWDIIQTGPPLYGVARGGIISKCEDEGIPCLLLEVGGPSGRLAPLLERTVDSLASGITNVMRHLDMLPGDLERPLKRWVVISGRDREVHANRGGILLENKSLSLKQRVAKGTLMARIVNLFGEVVEEIRAPKDGVIVTFHPNPVIIAGETATQIGTVERFIEEEG